MEKTDQALMILSNGTCLVQPGNSVTFTSESLSKRSFKPVGLEIDERQASAFSVQYLRVGVIDVLLVPATPAEVFKPGALGHVLHHTDFPVVPPGGFVSLKLKNVSTKPRVVRAQLVGRYLVS